MLRHRVRACVGTVRATARGPLSRGARFPDGTQQVAVDEVAALLAQFARLLGRFWRSPRFDADLSWVATPFARGVAPLLDDIGHALIADQSARQLFKVDDSVRSGSDSSSISSRPRSRLRCGDSTDLRSSQMPLMPTRPGSGAAEQSSGGFVVGWLICPPANYGMDTTTANIERMVAAVADLDGVGAVDAGPPI